MEKEKEMKINPEEGKEVEIDVNGYGCADDCDEYVEGKGWVKTAKTVSWW